MFVPVGALPKRVVQAFLAAEDKTFYRHPGIDVLGIARAVWTNVSRMRDNRRPIGASTITQQVAKNFLLTNEVSLERKLKEVLLAFRIERAFTKNQILELYLNEIYLGMGSYGVASTFWSLQYEPTSKRSSAPRIHGSVPSPRKCSAPRTRPRTSLRRCL